VDEAVTGKLGEKRGKPVKKSKMLEKPQILERLVLMYTVTPQEFQIARRKKENSSLLRPFYLAFLAGLTF
jgi:hypothetical protein